MAKDRLLHFMAQPPKVEKHGEFGMTAQFVIEVQPLFIRNSFQQSFACVPSFQPKSLFVPPKWIWNKIPTSRSPLGDIILRGARSGLFPSRRRTRPHSISPRSHAGSPSMA